MIRPPTPVPNRLVRAGTRLVRAGTRLVHAGMRPGEDADR